MDVGFNKPFKDQMQKQWLKRIIPKGIVHSTSSPPSKVDVAKWVNTTMAEIKGEGKTIRNVWKRHGYEWFLDEAI